MWRKGINTERFNPKWKNAEMRDRLSNNSPGEILLIYVGACRRLTATPPEMFCRACIVDQQGPLPLA